jgi:hypothetical protein
MDVGRRTWLPQLDRGWRETGKDEEGLAPVRWACPMYMTVYANPSHPHTPHTCEEEVGEGDQSDMGVCVGRVESKSTELGRGELAFGKGFGNYQESRFIPYIRKRKSRLS